MNTTLSRSKYQTARGPEFLLMRGQLELGMMTYLQSVKIIPERLEQFTEMLATRYLRSEIDHGTPMGARAATGISQPITQGSLNSIHGGSLKQLSSGFPRFQQLVNASNKVPYPITRIVLSERWTIDEMVRRKSELIEVTFGQIVKNPRTIPQLEPDEEPEWFDDFLEIYYPDKELPEPEWILKLDLDVIQMYEKQVTPEDLWEALEKDDPPTVMSLFSPLEEGVFYIYPIEEAVNKVIEEESKRRDMSSHHSKSLLMQFFITSVLIPRLEKILVRGVAGMQHIEPEFFTFFPTDDQTHRLTSTRRLAVNMKAEDPLKPYWKVDFNFDTFFNFHLKPSEFLDMLEVAEKAMGVEFHPKVNPQTFWMTPPQNELKLPPRLRSSYKLEREGEFIKVEVDLQKLFEMRLHPRTILDYFMMSGGRIVQFEDYHVIVESNPNNIRILADKSKSELENLTISEAQKRETSIREGKPFSEDLVMRQRIEDLEDIVTLSYFNFISAMGRNPSQLAELEIVDPNLTYTNNPHSILQVFGIEAVRNFYLREMPDVAGNTGIRVEPQYVLTLGDFITYTGMLTGFTYHGLRRQKSGTMGLAVFERTKETITSRAPFGGKPGTQDTAGSYIGSVMTGQRPAIGTGSSQILFTADSFRRSLQERKADSEPQISLPGPVTKVERAPREKRALKLEVRDQGPATIELGLSPEIGSAIEKPLNDAPEISDNRPAQRRKVVRKIQLEESDRKTTK